MTRIDAITRPLAGSSALKAPLFCVSPGVSTERALEQASRLLSCIDGVMGDDGRLSAEHRRRTVQYLIELALALVEYVQKQQLGQRPVKPRPREPLPPKDQEEQPLV